MKKYFSLFLIFTLSFVFAQKLLDARIITMENDTLQVKMKVKTNAFDPTLLYVTSFNTKINTVDENKTKSKIEVSTVKELTLTDYTGKNRFFFNKSDNKKVLLERLYNGENLEWWRDYSSTTGGENAVDFLYNKKTEKGTGLSYFTGIPKKKLKEFFSDEPQINIFIDESKSSPLRHAENNINAVMESIIRKYESLKSNKQ